MNKNKCNNCGAEFPEPYDFCVNCGTRKVPHENMPNKAAVDNNRCNKCGAELPETHDFCVNCGIRRSSDNISLSDANINNSLNTSDDAVVSRSEKKTYKQRERKTKHSKPAKTVIICAIVLLSLLGGIGIWLLLENRETFPIFGSERPVIEDTYEQTQDASEPMTQAETVIITRDTIPVNEIDIREKDIVTLRAETEPTHASTEFVWSSSNPDVLKVDTISSDSREITVVGESQGVAILTVDVNGITARCIFYIGYAMEDSPVFDEPASAVADVEGEVLRIREIWTQSRNVIENGNAQTSGTEEIKVHDADERTRMIDVSSGTNGISYSRIYCFHDGQLIFAFWFGDDQHRFYFKNEALFRWRHTPISGDFVTYDNRHDLADYLEWEHRVFNDINTLGIDTRRSDTYRERDFILDFSSERAITSSDLEGLSLEELRLARNEIYARHGYIFNVPVLIEWFNSKEWYRSITPKISREDFYAIKPSPLSNLEVENINKIVERENQLG